MHGWTFLCHCWICWTQHWIGQPSKASNLFRLCRQQQKNQGIFMQVSTHHTLWVGNQNIQHVCFYSDNSKLNIAKCPKFYSMIAVDLRTDMYRCVQETMTLRFPPRYFVHLGQPDPDHGPNSWSAIKPTLVSLIGQASDDHVLNEWLVDYTTNMAYFIGLTSNDMDLIFITWSNDDGQNNWS